MNIVEEIMGEEDEQAVRDALGIVVADDAGYGFDPMLLKRERELESFDRMMRQTPGERG